MYIHIWEYARQNLFSAQIPEIASTWTFRSWCRRWKFKLKHFLNAFSGNWTRMPPFYVFCVGLLHCIHTSISMLLNVLPGDCKPRMKLCKVTLVAKHEGVTYSRIHLYSYASYGGLLHFCFALPKVNRLWSFIISRRRNFDISQSSHRIKSATLGSSRQGRCHETKWGICNSGLFINNEI